jgi:hypothetical protein
VRDWRDFDAFKCFVRAVGSAGVRVQARELRDHERKSCAGFQNFGYVVILAWKANRVESCAVRTTEIGGFTSIQLEDYKGLASSTISSSHHHSIYQHTS